MNTELATLFIGISLICFAFGQKPVPKMGMILAMVDGTVPDNQSHGDVISITIFEIAGIVTQEWEFGIRLWS